MRRVDIRLVAAFILCAGAAGCAASRPAAPQPSPESRAAEARARCRGTLAIETVPISQRVRKSLGLPDSVKGALVQEVLPGGPGAAAGIRPNDVVQEVGPARITSDCQFVDAAYGRACAPVRVVLWRAGSVLEIDVAPVDQDAFLESSCRGGTAGGCFRLAWALWARNEGTGRERALELYHAACQGGYAEACAHEGLHRMNAPDTASEAVQVLERACELGSGSGCAHLAFLYATGKTVAKNDRRAAALYVTSCDRGDARGCYNVGLMAEEGRGGARDLSRAAAKYQEACDSGSSAACTNLGFLYENGRGVRKDAARALALYQRGCDGGSCEPSNLTGCVNVGRAYRDGIGAAKNATRAAEIFRQACDRAPHPDDVHAEQNRSRACSLLGALYLAGDGVERDLNAGLELSALGCDRGDAFGCFNAAAVFASGAGVEKDPAKAASFLSRACDGGDGEGCHDLAVAYEKGSGVTRDPRRAAQLRRKACELGFAAACAKKGR